jgi:hypothetical protein
VGQDPHGRGNRKNQEEPNHQERQGQLQVSGLLHDEGLPNDLHSGVTRERAREVQVDVSGNGTKVLHGASYSDGKKAEKTAQDLRSRSSSERCQDGQPTGELRIARHELAQKRALASLKRGEKAPTLVRESDVPQVWLRYFEESGLEVLCRDSAAMALDEQSGYSKSGATKRNIEAYDGTSNTSFLRGVSNPSNQHGDSGGASRFFYVAKASKSERNKGLEGLEGLEVHRYGAGLGQGRDPAAPTVDKNFHPTVKPIKLMTYLCRLITPPQGIVLDPFMGSGSTGVAAVKEGFGFIGIEREPSYFEICKARIGQEAK